MSSRALSVRRELPVVVLFTLAALLLTWDHQKDDSPTLDEPLHLFAGAEYVENGTYGVNLEHPPLTKLLAGWALRPLRLQPPAPGSRVPSPRDDYFRFLYGNRAPADAIVSAARRPFPWLLAALVLLVWAFGLLAFGKGVGLLAAGLVALDPNFIGHGGVVHTDVAAALVIVAAVGAALLAVTHGGAARWLAAGVLMGVALATKFSAILVIPVVLALPLVGKRSEGGRRPALGGVAAAAAALVLAVVTLAAIYGMAMRQMTLSDALDSEATFLRGRGASEVLVSRLSRLTSAIPPLGHYVAGLAGVSLLDRHGRGANYLLGRVSDSGFPSYFFVAFLVKSTPAFLVLTLAILLAGGRLLLSPWRFGLLATAATFFGAAVRSNFNIGIRHLLPIYPMLALVGAGVLAARLRPRIFVWSGAVLVASSALSLAASHPEEIAYFNFIAGGSRSGAAWLSDSNLDWGQDLKRLGAFLKERGWERETTVVAYSGLATNYYMRDCRVLEPGRPIEPGRYAVSALLETIGPEFVRTFEGEASARQLRELLERLKRRGRRLERVGASITIWDLPPGPS